MFKKGVILFLGLIVWVGGGIFISSCEKDDICPENHLTTPDAVIEFMSIVDQNLTQVDLTGVNFYAIEGADTEPINTSSTFSSIELPLNLRTEFSQFRIVYPDLSEDTLEVTYVPQLEFISKACGFRYIFNQVNVTSTDNNIEEILLNIADFTSPNQLISSQQVTATIVFKPNP